jgi:hypothetical protein
MEPTIPIDPSYRHSAHLGNRWDRTHRPRLRSHRSPTCNVSSKISDAEKKAIEDASSAVKEALKGEDIEDIKKKTEALVQASMKLGEAIYKSQQSAKPESGKDDGGDDAGKKDENVVDADFEERTFSC